MRAALPWPIALAVGLAACGNGEPRPPPGTLQNRPRGGVAEDPRGAGCADPVAGVWTARVWREESDEWDEVQLTIRRDGDRLEGEITVTTWDGDRTQLEPPQCPDRSPAISRVVQRASGSVDRDRFAFHGSDPRRVVVPCGVYPDAGYNPDHFTGDIDRAGDRLLARNDDGNVDDARPHDFERTRCRP